MGGRRVVADAAGIARAAAVLAEGGVLVCPTDTVYGLACDLWQREAVQRIYAIKGRPAHLPLIAMFADPAAWPAVASSLPASAATLMRAGWPGPLTLIVPARTDLPPEVLGGGTTIGMRIPDHAVARALLAAAGRPLATTSANPSGRPAARTVEEAQQALGDAVDLYLDAGPSPVGAASTVVDCTTTPPTILREGPVGRDRLAAWLGIKNIS